jgi:hypothetical protein
MRAEAAFHATQRGGSLRKGRRMKVEGRGEGISSQTLTSFDSFFSPSHFFLLTSTFSLCLAF